jgi:hypothetical protein
MSWFSIFAVMITLHQFMLLFYAQGFVIPIRYLFGAFMCLQMLLGPVLAFNGLDQYQRGNYKMQISEAEYFSYVIPAVILFIAGLHFNTKKLKGEIVNENLIKQFVIQHPDIPYVLVVIGFLSSLIADFFSSDIAFVFTLLGGFKFIGAFIFVLGKSSFRPLPVIIVFTSIIVSSLSHGMFHDLLTWLLILGSVLAIKFKPKDSVKAIFAFSFVLVAIVIQQVKGDYREATWQKGEEASLGTLSRAYEESQQRYGFFSLSGLAASSVRINQGFIITHIMKNIPRREPYAEGKELMKIVEAAILPRVLAPNKLNAGDREIFMKYSGMRIARGTSMGLSSVGDGYINFGAFGGCIFMFLLGLLFNEVLKGFYKYSIHFPVLILFTPLVFYYPIRPDCELQTILGHLVKSCFLIFVLFAFLKKYFIVHSTSPEKDIHNDSLVPSGL